MRKKLDPNELCETFNKLRIDNQHKKFSSKEMRELLHKFGFNAKLFETMSRTTFFRKRRTGQFVEYAFTDFPIYKAQFVKLLDSIRTQKPKAFNFTEEDAVKMLKGLGYRLSKCEGVDIDALQIQCPDIYNKFVVYKEV